MMAMSRVTVRCLMASVTLLFAINHVCAQTEPAQPQPSQGGKISGIVKSRQHADSRRSRLDLILVLAFI